MPFVPVSDRASGPGLPVSARVSSPLPASGWPPTKIGLALPVATVQRTGADTNGAVLPFDSFSASPFEMLSTLIVNLVALCAMAPCAAARSTADTVTARTNDMDVSCSGSGGERSRGEVDAEATAPDGDCAVLGQVEVGRDVVVLVALVALELAE